MNQLPITEIEDALLALPRYRETERESLELRLMATYVAALYDATFWKLKKFTGYPDAVIAKAVGALEKNDCIRDGRAVESFVRARTKADALIDRVFGMGESVSAPAPAAIVAPKRNGNAVTTVTELMRAGIAAVSQTGQVFGRDDVLDWLHQQGHNHLGDTGAAFTTEARRLVQKGFLKLVQKGVTGSPATYALAGSETTHASSKPRTKTNIARETILSQRGQFTLADVRPAFYAAGGENTPNGNQVLSYAMQCLVKEGRLQVVEQRANLQGGSVYEIVGANAVPDPRQDLRSDVQLMVAETPRLQTVALPPNVLPGPGKATPDLVEELQFLERQFITDAEACRRVRFILERERSYRGMIAA